jgi:hypothetical protein
MAKKSKRAKSKSAKKKSAKTAKRKSAKKKSARTAASKRAASKRAKTKVAKRKTAKRKAPPRRTKEDPCQRERDNRDRVFDQVQKLEKDLSDRDIPPDLRQRLEALLAQAQGRLTFLQKKLDECEAEHRPAKP